jgi:hypothetical protein
VSAPLTATLLAGRVIPATFAAQLRAANDAPAGSPLTRTPKMSFPYRGEPQPGKAIPGTVNGACTSPASCDGQETCWLAANTPSDCQPMLTLVPIDT